MNKIGIIAEYNPFHNGHEYQISRAKELAGSEYVIVCMSGNFVQRGGPAIVDKNIRARMAIENGASIVIELPMPFSCQSAEDFAYASIMELKKMEVSHLSFGAETDNVNLLYDIANMQLDENSIYNIHVKKYLDDGLSYANACMNAVMDCYKNSDFADEINQVFKANNILGIEYIKACIKLDYEPEIIIVKRTGNDHNEINDRQGKYSSAMSIRRNILAGDLNIENKITFIEELENKEVKELISSSKLYVITSQREGFSYTFAESLVLKTPLLSTDVADIKKTIGEKYIVPFDDPKKLSEKIYKQDITNKENFILIASNDTIINHKPITTYYYDNDNIKNLFIINPNSCNKNICQLHTIIAQQVNKNDISKGYTLISEYTHKVDLENTLPNELENIKGF